MCRKVKQIKRLDDFNIKYLKRNINHRQTEINNNVTNCI